MSLDSLRLCLQVTVGDHYGQGREREMILLLTWYFIFLTLKGVLSGHKSVTSILPHNPVMLLSS